MRRSSRRPSSSSRGLIAEIDCDPQDGGHLYIAHRPKIMPKLEKQSQLLNETFGYPTRIIGRAELHANYLADQEAAGAMHEPDGMASMPASSPSATWDLARKLGATVHTASPVTGWQTKGGVHHLTTPGGTVRARAVGLATAGYTPPGLHDLTRHRLMPILSNSVVTRPLTDAERAACGFKTTMVLTDTRTLRHYYRLLPDGRVQIGSRSAVTGSNGGLPSTSSSCSTGSTASSRRCAASGSTIPGGAGSMSATI